MKYHYYHWKIILKTSRVNEMFKKRQCFKCRVLTHILLQIAQDVVDFLKNMDFFQRWELRLSEHQMRLASYYTNGPDVCTRHLVFQKLSFERKPKTPKAFVKFLLLFPFRCYLRNLFAVEVWIISGIPERERQCNWCIIFYYVVPRIAVRFVEFHCPSDPTLWIWIRLLVQTWWYILDVWSTILD